MLISVRLPKMTLFSSVSRIPDKKSPGSSGVEAKVVPALNSSPHYEDL